MRAKWIYLLTTLTVVATVACAIILDSGRPKTISLSALSALSILLLIALYCYSVRPLNTLISGIDLIRAQDFSSRLAHVGSADANRIIDMFNTMMDHLKQQRLRVRETNHFLDLLVSVSPMGILTLDDKGAIVMSNPAAAQYLGVEAEGLNGLRLENLNGELAKSLSQLRHGEVMTLRMGTSCILRLSRLSFMDRGFAHPFLLIEQLTDEVVKAEKTAYHNVIRMIAHEVNNTMTGIDATMATISSMIDDSHDPTLADLREVLDVTGERTRSMSKFISSYAEVVKIPDANTRPLSLSGEIQRISGFLESMCSSREVTIQFDNSADDDTVMLDPVLFEQAMVNIVKNAVESITDCKEQQQTPYHGRITIVVTTDEDSATLTVTDNGSGISEDVRRKLFSPFYSTKKGGQGLGLIMISEVLSRHNCRFRLATDTDALTRFVITFTKCRPQ